MFKLKPSALAIVASGILLSACADHSPVAPPPGLSVGTLPDYVVTEARVLTDSALDDLSTATFEVDVRNLGGSDLFGTSVAMYVDSVFVTEVPLEIGHTFSDTTITFEWDPEGGQHEILFGVDRPPLDTTFVPELNEENNTFVLSLSVPYRTRAAPEPDSLLYSALPAHVRNDPRVQQMLTVALNSGFSLLPGAMTHRARYEEDGVTTLATPLGSPDAAADSVPVLMIMRVSAGEDSTTVVNMVQVVDSLTTIIHDFEGGAQVFTGEEVALTPPATPAHQASLLGGSCSEAWFRPCVLAFGPAAVKCLRTAFPPTPPRSRQALAIAIARALARCIPAAVRAPACAKALKDNPPVLNIVPVRNGPRCEKCVNNDLVAFTYHGYRATFTDDRGAAFITASSFVPTCQGGRLRIAVKDCGGNITGQSVAAVYRELSRSVNLARCKHDQGGTYTSLAWSQPSIPIAWAMRDTCARMRQTEWVPGSSVAG